MVWEERWHPLRREWVIVSAHRDHRPWRGETVAAAPRTLPEYVADCYLCPGNTRISGVRNDNYTGVFVFDNDHPCVAPDAPDEVPAPGIYHSCPATGLSRVVCFTPRHDLTLAELPHAQIVDLLHVLQQQYRELGTRPEVSHVLMFENKGEVVGVSNPHPHCQIYATNFVFKTIEIEAAASAAHLADTGRVLFADIIDAEETDGRRVLVRNHEALSFVPYFARYPFETFVAPRSTRASLAELTDVELNDFADVLRQTLIRLENLWRMPFPYVMVLHQAPTDGGAYPGFHFHIQIHPPLRRPGLLKYLAGPEIGGGNFLNDVSPEESAAQLRVVASIHYRQETTDA
jgi:UDPglucose--hexose-1-phosphate uridylyltransferase